MLVIADDAQAVGMAGVMGSWDSKAELSTKNIFLEAAFFAPEIGMAPLRRWPPVMRILSIFGSCSAGRAQGRRHRGE